MSTTPDRSPAPRYVWIDCLRAFCVFAVLCTHGLIKIPPDAPFLSTVFAPFYDKGYFAVATFFVISGFLITGNTLRRYGEPSKIDFGQFYAMRVARILPLLLLFIVTMVALAYSGWAPFHPPSNSLLWGSVYAALTFQYNSYYFTANAPGLAHWSPLWSLSIEEMFYLTFPLVCFLTRRRVVFVVLLLGLVAIGPVVRKEFADVFNFWGAADLLSLGALTALAVNRFATQITRFARVLIWVGFAIILCVYSVSQVRENFGLTPTILGLGTALFLAGSSAISRGANDKLVAPVAALGRVSYEIYVFHVAIIMVLRPPVVALVTSAGLPSLAVQLVTFVILLGAVYGVGYLISRYFTEPLNTRIRRFYAQRTVASVVT